MDPSGVATENDLDDYRAEFPVTATRTYLNHAAVSPVSNRLTKAAAQFFDDCKHLAIEGYPRWVQRVEQTRTLFAQLINADSREVAFVGNTSEGLSAVATGLNWRPGDIVLVPESDFPTNIYPWMNLAPRGVSVRFFRKNQGRFGIGEVEKALSPKTRLISVSSVDFRTGFRSDLEALGVLCREKGILFCVDAIQSLGVIPMDVSRYGIHFLAAGGHKWLLSAMGCGCLFISHDVADRLHPEKVGWKSVVDETNFSRIHFELKSDARRFEPGTLNFAGIHALGAALELLLEVGVERIYHRVREVNDLLYEGLRRRGQRVATSMRPAERSGILTFSPSAPPDLLFRFLTKRKVSVSLRGNMIRLSPHFYNNSADTVRFFQELDRFLERE